LQVSTITSTSNIDNTCTCGLSWYA